MRRRLLLTVPALAALPALTAPAALPRPRSWSASELRAGVDPRRARRMAARLRVPVRPVASDRVAALNAGHLEAALLDNRELAEARRLMGARLAVLPGAVAGLTPVSRSVLSPALRADLAATLLA